MMDNADKVTLDRVKTEIMISFTKMTLEQIEAARSGINCTPEMIREIRECAQAIPELVSRL